MYKRILSVQSLWAERGGQAGDAHVVHMSTWMVMCVFTGWQKVAHVAWERLGLTSFDLLCPILGLVFLKMGCGMLFREYRMVWSLSGSIWWPLVFFFFDLEKGKGRFWDRECQSVHWKEVAGNGKDRVPE